MTMHSFYCLDNGLLTGKSISCPDHAVEMNTPEGCGVVLGQHDHLSRRVDLDTGEIVDYQPPQPSAQHEWNAETQRWVYVPTALEQCIANRTTSYPPLTELADAIFWQAQGDPTKMEAYLSACAAVKKAYPKP